MTKDTQNSATDKLARLATSSPPAARGLTMLVNENYNQIKAARKKGWPWADIANALDLPSDRVSALSSAYARRKQRSKAVAARKERGGDETRATAPSPPQTPNNAEPAAEPDTAESEPPLDGCGVDDDFDDCDF